MEAPRRATQKWGGAEGNAKSSAKEGNERGDDDNVEGAAKGAPADERNDAAGR